MVEHALQCKVVRLQGVLLGHLKSALVLLVKAFDIRRYPLNLPMSAPDIAAPVRASDTPPAELGNQPSGDSTPHAEQLVAMAKMIGESRHRREKFLAPELFAEPGWEMLLALYRAHAAAVRMTVSNLCRMSEGPVTSAVRWIDRLESLGLVSRHRSLHDARVFFVELTPEAHAQIRDYLMETWASMFDAK
jgi:DNA-binding MarR family transcriptional regulator